MALVDLQTPIWQYDTATKEFVITFLEAPPANEPDKASYVPTRKAVLRLNVPAGIQIINLPTPPTP